MRKWPVWKKGTYPWFCSILSVAAVFESLGQTDQMARVTFGEKGQWDGKGNSVTLIDSFEACDPF